ncbi:rhomboid family intramembrane serine protease [Planctomycetota bacterium]
MGLYDRDYTQEGGGGYHDRPQMRLAMPALTPVIKWLLIVNAVIFFLSALSPRLGALIDALFAVDTRSWPTILQPWRLLTYQFLHASFGHFFFNMLMLYFMGTILERQWGTKRFLWYYLGCGVFGALFYYLLVIVRWLHPGYMVGASGAILGVLAACAILFPQIKLYIWGIFPIPIRVLALILIGYAVLTIMQGQRGQNAGGEAAHLGGMVAGAAYVLSQSWRKRMFGNLQQRRTQQQFVRQQDLQAEVDRVLAKVHEHGIHSLTRQEKLTLKQATEAEQKNTGLRF